MLRSLLSLACFVALSGAAYTQDVVPLEEAQRGARKVTDVLGTPADAPFKLEVDVTKPQAIKAGKAGLLIIPDKQLSAESFANIGTDITPIGQLWTLNVSLGKDGQAVPNEKLRLLTVSEGNEDHDVHLYYLGASKNSEGKLDLVVFGKEKEPLLKLPLAKGSDASPSQILPIEISGKKEDDNTGTLSLHLLGGYNVDLTVKRPAE